MIEVVLDFETASDAELATRGKKIGVGAWRYAEDVTTEILCLVCHIEGVGIQTWRPGEGVGTWLELLSLNQETIFIAHNAGFEQAIWQRIMVERYGFPEIPIERWRDTMAVGAWKALAMSLDTVSSMLRLRQQKDKEGSSMTIGLSKARKDGSYDRSRETMQRVVDYCKNDVTGQLELHRRLGHLSPEEQHVWNIDQRINRRGIGLDLAFIAAAQRVVDAATAPLLCEFRDLTGGLAPGQVAKIIDWARDQGAELENLQKGTIAALLGEEDDDDGSDSLLDDPAGPPVASLPDQVRKALKIRSMLGSSSIKKLAAMRACVGYDGRARGLVQYAAAHTLRWGGRILQPQNFPRGDWGRTGIDPAKAIAAISSGDPEVVERELGMPAIKAVGDALRFALVAGPGKVFVSGDFAGIEMRVDLALAGQHDKCELLASGADVYLDMADKIFGKPSGYHNKVEHVLERTIGKNAVLGCGFQMGPETFFNRYCSDQSVQFAEQVVEAYRKKWAPRVPNMWYELQSASIEAVKNRTTVETSQGIRFSYPRGSDWIMVTYRGCWQQMWYYQPRFEREGGRFGDDCWSYLGVKKGHPTRIQMYGGIITENIVQWLARGILAQAMSRLESRGYELILTVHDECVAETTDRDEDRFRAIMEEQPDWVQAMGVPIQVETWCYERYRK